jgi:hypothetical protein
MGLSVGGEDASGICPRDDMLVGDDGIAISSAIDDRTRSRTLG